jgi:hypothetical protein
MLAQVEQDNEQQRQSYSKYEQLDCQQANQKGNSAKTMSPRQEMILYKHGKIYRNIRRKHYSPKLGILVPHHQQKTDFETKQKTFPLSPSTTEIKLLRTRNNTAHDVKKKFSLALQIKLQTSR